MVLVEQTVLHKLWTAERARLRLILTDLFVLNYIFTEHVSNT